LVAGKTGGMEKNAGGALLKPVKERSRGRQIVCITLGPSNSRLDIMFIVR
jgi:hypothetical protein